MSSSSKPVKSSVLILLDQYEEPFIQYGPVFLIHFPRAVAGRMLLNDSKKGPPHVQYRRPYGCAVLAMSDVLQTISELKEEKDFVLKVYT